MSTKCIVLGESEMHLKKIEFILVISNNSIVSKPIAKPEGWKNIELIQRACETNNAKGLDIMFAYDDDRSKGRLYLGYWNSGIV
jgi:hypothetical protein